MWCDNDGEEKAGRGKKKRKREADGQKGPIASGAGGGGGGEGRCVPDPCFETKVESPKRKAGVFPLTRFLPI